MVITSNDWFRFLVQHLNKKTCMTWQCLQLCLKFLRVITAPSLPMVRQGQGRHIQWKEEPGKRFDFAGHVSILSFAFLCNYFQLHFILLQNGEFPSDAGVIPRAVKQIFDILEAQNAEYSMKVTFLELYNEEITDLLALEETSKFIDDKSKKPIALMEDGKGGVFVRGLEEEIVYTANEIYKFLEKGSAKRRTAETLLNKQSSRSHSIFSITIHIKECTPEGEEVIKCGKLNLVDLAGSENISRSGAREVFVTNIISLSVYPLDILI